MMRVRAAVLPPPARRFGELAKLVDPSNEPKTDKLSILSESIRYVQQTQLENSQLRQLNKFLEVRGQGRRVVVVVAVSRCSAARVRAAC